MNEPASLVAFNALTHRLCSFRNSVRVQHGRDELLVVDLPRAVDVRGMEQLLHLDFVNSSADLGESIVQVIAVDPSILVGVHCCKELLNSRGLSLSDICVQSSTPRPPPSPEVS